MKKIFICILIFSLFSCGDEEESISFHLMEHGHYADIDYMSIDYSVIAPGRVNIEDHGVEYWDILNIDTNRVSFGPLSKPGNYHNYVDYLQPSTSYYFRLYAVSNGRVITSNEFPVTTQSLP